MRITLIVLTAALWAGCGGDGITSNPGGGTKTLRVQAEAEWDPRLNAAQLEVDVEKADQDIANALVTIHSDLGDVTLVYDAGRQQRYYGQQAGWAAQGYEVSVVVKDAAGNTTDELSGSVRAAAPVKVSAPDMLKPFDPHTLEGGVLVLKWGGPAGDTARVRTRRFEPADFAPDPMQVSIPAINLTRTDQELEIRRNTAVILAGGAPDSHFTTTWRLETSFIIINPFPE